MGKKRLYITRVSIYRKGKIPLVKANIYYRLRINHLTKLVQRLKDKNL